MNAKRGAALIACAAMLGALFMGMAAGEQPGHGAGTRSRRADGDRRHGGGGGKRRAALLCRQPDRRRGAVQQGNRVYLELRPGHRGGREHQRREKAADGIPAGNPVLRRQVHVPGAGQPGRLRRQGRAVRREIAPRHHLSLPVPRRADHRPAHLQAGGGPSHGFHPHRPGKGGGDKPAGGHFPAALFRRGEHAGGGLFPGAGRQRGPYPLQQRQAEERRL